MATDPGFEQVLITGASAGIGAAFARALAPAARRTLLVARRAQRLQALAEELRGPGEVLVLPADLGATEGQTRVVEAIRQGPALDLLVNNAGFSTRGPFAASDLDTELAMLRLHQDAALALTRAALPAMRAARRGALINVASIGGFACMPSVASYAASKAFLISFSRSLHAELTDTGVRVQCLCPGYTRTEIHSRDTFAGFDVERVPAHLWMQAEAVVAESLAALAQDAPPWLLVPGERNRQFVSGALQDLAAAL